jgi:hypothetical protein
MIGIVVIGIVATTGGFAEDVWRRGAIAARPHAAAVRNFPRLRRRGGAPVPPWRGHWRARRAEFRCALHAAVGGLKGTAAAALRSASPLGDSAAR